MMLALLLAVPGCITHEPPLTKAPDLEANTSEMLPDSLPVEVTEFTWAILNEGAHLRVTGQTRNVGPEPLQSITLTGQVLDQGGRALGQGTATIYPTYLPVGKGGSFEITIMMPRDRKDIKFINLRTRAVTLR
jgi:hypothetical protein